MTDFHIHLARLPAPSSLLDRFILAQKGVNSIACEPWEWDKSLQIIQEFQDKLSTQLENKNLCFAFGIHPMIAAHIFSKDLDQLEKNLLSNSCFMVGEGGLDKRFEGYEPGGIQDQVFEFQVQLACKLNRPLQIHCVGDYGRIIRMLKENHLPAGLAIFHRFGGDTSTVRSAASLAPLYSLHQDSFRKKATREAILEIPEEQIRFETDADESFVEKFGNDPAELSKQLEIVESLYRQLKKRD